MEPERYRPANGTEGEIFRDQWCSSCVNEELGTFGYCEIMADSMCFCLDDPSYPKELIYDEQGIPCCTAWKVRGDESAIIRSIQEEHGQMRLF